MPNKISTTAGEKFVAQRNFSGGNTQVINKGYETEMRLFGNLIAVNTGEDVRFTDAGWPTVTTFARLNGILERLGRFRIVRRDWCEYIECLDERLSKTDRLYPMHRWMSLSSIVKHFDSLLEKVMGGGNV